MKKEHVKTASYILLSVALIFTISFGIGLFKGRRKDIADIPEKISFVPEPSSTPKPVTQPDEPEYYLIDEENGKIKLYFVKGDNLTELRSEIIPTDVFPKEDMLILSEGIKTNTSEEALKVWENFIS